MLRKYQLAGHKRAGPKTKNGSSVFNLQKSPLGNANMVAKKKEIKNKEREKGKMTGR